jgi:uncharacterized membrane protein
LCDQVYFGFFVGLAVYTLLILATVDPPFNPVFGAMLALVLTVIALMLIIVLLYTTINQMRPAVVVDAIHDRILAAREQQLSWLSKTLRAPRLSADRATTVHADRHGYVVRLDVDALQAIAEKTSANLEIVLRVSIGEFVAFQDTLAEIRGNLPDATTKLVDAVRNAIHIEEQRNLDTDSAYVIEQLANIAWTSVSTAKSNPSPGLLVIHSLRDVLARWSADSEQVPDVKHGKSAVVYTDNAFARLLSAFETQTVVASESMQPQTAAEIVNTLSLMFARLPAEQQSQAEDLIRRSLSALGEHVLTAELDTALSQLTTALKDTGRLTTAQEVNAAHRALANFVGKLGSRATRAANR